MNHYSNNILPSDNSTLLKSINQSSLSKKQSERLSLAAWNFAYSLLWNGTHLSAKEIEGARLAIENYITSEATSPSKACTVFCEQVILARKYVTSTPGKYIPLPSVWLHPGNENGYQGTRKRYSDLKQMRSSLPDFKRDEWAWGNKYLTWDKEL